MAKKPKTSDANLVRVEPDDGLNAVIPAGIVELLGPPPLIGSETPSRFRRFMTLFVVEFDPKSISEWMLVVDIVNVSWEIQRYRRARTTLITLSCPKVASELFFDNMLEQFKFAEFIPDNDLDFANSDQPSSQKPADETHAENEEMHASQRFAQSRK